MLQTVEILPGSRRSLRRAVSLEAELIAAPWAAPRKHRVLDLSPEGMRLAAGTRLPEGELLLVTFTPPGWWLLGELSVWARVARSEPREAERPATMGLEFLTLPEGLHDQLGRTLRGTPPPLPNKPRAVQRELVWVDVLLTYTEDLGDRVNTFEVSEAVALDELEAALTIEPLAPVLTGGAAVAA